MTRLIDADALVDKFAHPNELIYTFGVLNEIEKAPTIDAAPVMHGEWIVHNPDNPLTIYGECPFCHEEVGRKWKYCPNCGAKMDRVIGGCKMYKTITEVQNIISAYDTLWDATHEIATNLNLYGEGCIKSFTIGNKTTDVNVDMGFDWFNFSFPSVYYTMGKDEYVVDWEKRKKEEQKKRNEEIARFGRKI